MIKIYQTYWTHLLDLHGRASRKAYWIPIVINYVLSFMLILLFKNILAAAVTFSNIDSVNNLFVAIVHQMIILLTWLATFSIKVRRLHDTNRSGWWVFISFIPVVGTLYFIVLMLLPSKKLANNTVTYQENRPLLLTVVGLAAAVSVISIVWRNYQTYTNSIYQASEVKKWSADQHALLSNQAFKQLLTKYQHQKSTGVMPKAFKTIIIPGLHGAWSINHQTKQATFGSNWVPQGLTENDDSYFISAYDGNHRLNSLIFIVDKQTGKYQKSIILSRKAHVGGLAYDRDHQLLWISDDTHQSAQVLALRLATINRYQAAKVHQPIKADQIAPLKWASRTSGLSYFKNNLLIVKYGNNINNRSVVDFEVNHQTGFIKPATMRTPRVSAQEAAKMNRAQFITMLKNQGLIKSYSPGYNRMQGLAVLPTKDQKSVFTLYTQSNGDQSSHLIINRSYFKNDFDFSHISKRNNQYKKLASIAIPPSAEQVSANASTHSISLLFEGGAREYRKYRLGLLQTPFSDRILVMKY